jgi:hypothetical protein
MAMEGMLWALNTPNDFLTLGYLDEQIPKSFYVWMKRGYFHFHEEWLIMFSDQ